MKKIKLDATDLWGVAVPWGGRGEAEPTTHYLIGDDVYNSRRDAITGAVRDYSDNDRVWPLAHHGLEREEKLRRSEWRKLYSKGWRVVKLDVRVAKKPEEKTTAEIEAVTCPTCGAAGGQMCRWPDGTFRNHPHAKRARV